MHVRRSALPWGVSHLTVHSAPGACVLCVPACQGSWGAVGPSGVCAQVPGLRWELGVSPVGHALEHFPACAPLSTFPGRESGLCAFSV